MEGERYGGRVGTATFISLTGWNDGPKGVGGTAGKDEESEIEGMSGEWGCYRIEHPLESDMGIALTGRHRRSECETLEAKRARAHRNTT